MGEPSEIYKGTKNYWRLRANVDFNIILHPKLDTLEVVAYHPILFKESRIYLSYSKLKAKVNPEKLEVEVNNRKDELHRKRKSSTKEEINSWAVNNLIADYITTRATISMEEATQSFTLALQINFGDAVGPDGRPDVLLDKPDTLTEFTVFRHQQTNSNDVAEIIAALRADQRRLTEACENANRMASLVNKTSDGFKHMMDYAKHVRNDLDHASIHKKRWIKAIRRVILQNTVAKIQKQIARCNFGPWPAEIEAAKRAAAEAASIGGVAVSASEGALHSPRLLEPLERRPRALTDPDGNNGKGPTPIKGGGQPAKRRSTISEKLPAMTEPAPQVGAASTSARSNPKGGASARQSVSEKGSVVASAAAAVENGTVRRKTTLTPMPPRGGNNSANGTSKKDKSAIPNVEEGNENDQDEESVVT